MVARGGVFYSFIQKLECLGRGLGEERSCLSRVSFDLLVEDQFELIRQH